MRRLSKSKYQSLSLTAYHSLVASHLSYGIELWGSATHSRLVQLLKVQKRCVRAILGLPYHSHCLEGFKTLGIMTVFSMYIYKILLYAKEQVERNSFVKVSNTHKYNTRNLDNLVMSKYSNSKAEKSPDHKAKFYFNLLPKALQLSSSKTFKNTLRNFFMENPMYDLNEIVVKLGSIC